MFFGSRPVRLHALVFVYLTLFVSLLTGCGNKDDVVSSLDTVNSCEEQTEQAVALNRENQMNFYRQHGGTLPLPQHQSYYYRGTNGRAVVLVHGFIASPASMTDIAQALNESGYSVIVPLLTGFGDGPEAANSATLEDWKASVREAVDTARLCHGDVSLVAHSLGTSLSTLELGDGTERRVDRVVLLAPYFKSYGKWLSYLSGIIGMGTDTIYLSDVKRYTGIDPYDVFALEHPKQGEREMYLPIRAMQQVLALQDVFATPVEDKLSVPVLAFITEDDAIVDGEYATTYLSNRFENAQFVIYPRAEKIEHSFQAKKKNPNFDVMIEQIRAYLAGGAEASIGRR